MPRKPTRHKHETNDENTEQTDEQTSSQETEDEGLIPLSQVEDAAGFLSLLVPGNYRDASKQTLCAIALWIDSFADGVIDTDD